MMLEMRAAAAGSAVLTLELAARPESDGELRLPRRRVSRSGRELRFYWKIMQTPWWGFGRAAVSLTAAPLAR